MILIEHQTMFGKIGLAEHDGRLTRLLFAADLRPTDTVGEQSTLLMEAAAQLDAYLAGKLQSFDLPLGPEGTTFQRQVWMALGSIPYGKTISYGEIAAVIDKPKAARAIGLACNRNPLPIFIPCHRVLGANKRLVGYRGGLDLKKQLLALESRIFIDNCAKR